MMNDALDTSIGKPGTESHGRSTSERLSPSTDWMVERSVIVEDGIERFKLHL